jgi:hypothetical protein
MICQRKTPPCGSFRRALEDIQGLSVTQKKILEDRYLCILESFEYRTKLYAFLFHTCRFIVTVGSLIVPALLSIQYVDTGSSNIVMNPGDFSFQIYWTTWVISLLVTTSNGIFTLFKVDKKYYLLHTMYEQLRSEGWQYLELSGRFSGFYTPREKPTHANQFLFFCHAVEKLKMKQVEEEYYKPTESNLHATNTHSTNHKHEANTTDIESGAVPKNTVIPQVPAFFTNGLIPPTPLNPQLQQLLQALTVEGANGHKQQVSSEMPVRSEVPPKSPGKESILREASKTLPATESFNRIRAEVPAEQMEQKPQTQTDA